MVKFHETGRDAPTPAVKWQHEKGFLRISVRRNYQSEIIRRHIEQETGRHQLGVAHVVIFIFVKGLEPRSIHDRILRVIVRDVCRHIFASKISSDEIGHIVAGVGTKVETWTVKWIDKSRGVTDARRAIATKFLGVVRQCRKRVQISLNRERDAKKFKYDRNR